MQKAFVSFRDEGSMLRGSTLVGQFPAPLSPLIRPRGNGRSVWGYSLPPKGSKVHFTASPGYRPLSACDGLSLFPFEAVTLLFLAIFYDLIIFRYIDIVTSIISPSPLQVKAVGRL